MGPPLDRTLAALKKEAAPASSTPTIPVADLPVKALTEPILYRLEGVPSPESQKAANYPLNEIPLPHDSPTDILLNLLKSPNIASKESVYRQYDTQVQTNTVLTPGAADAALLRVKGTTKGLAIATDGNGRYCWLDPFVGGAIAVAEASRNVSCVGAEPVALTDCLNFGNPERPEIYHQLEHCIRGMAEACRALNLPVVSGNVSLYNETRGDAIFPTPIVGALGLTQNVERRASSAFQQPGDLVVLIGASAIYGRNEALAGSEYLELFHNLVAGRPSIDLDLEAKVQALCRRAIAENIIASAHDCSDGGLAVAIAESCILGNIGFNGDFDYRRTMGRRPLRRNPIPHHRLPPAPKPPPPPIPRQRRKSPHNCYRKSRRQRNNPPRPHQPPPQNRRLHLATPPPLTPLIPSP